MVEITHDGMPIKTVEIKHTLRMLGHAVHDGAEYVPRRHWPTGKHAIR